MNVDVLAEMLCQENPATHRHSPTNAEGAHHAHNNNLQHKIGEVNRLIVIRLQTVRILPSISKSTSGKKAHAKSLSRAKRCPTNSHRDRDPQRCNCHCHRQKGFGLQDLPKTSLGQYTKLTRVDHTTKHRHTTATCEAVGHAGHTNERCTQSYTLL